MTVERRVPVCEISDNPSTAIPGEGCFMVWSRNGGSGFCIGYHPETKDAARKVAEEWLRDNADLRRS